MKSLTIFAPLAAAALTVPAGAQEGVPLVSADATRLDISVTGTAERVPDLAIISAGVVTRAGTAREAIAANAAQMKRVFAALEAAGIAERDIQTDSINLNPQYDYRDNQTPRLTGYMATNTVSIRFRDIEKSGDILDALVGAGANQINGPQLIIDEPAEAFDEARREALEEGRKRAELYASALGKRVVRLAMVSESANVSRPPVPMMARMEAAQDASATQIRPGEQELSVTLTMSFDLR